MGNLVLKGNYLFGVTFYKKHTNTKPLCHPLLKQAWILPAMLHISICYIPPDSLLVANDSLEVLASKWQVSLRLSFKQSLT